MKNIVLEVGDNEYPLLLQFLRTLQYVRINESVSVISPQENNQLMQLKRILQKQTSPLFKDISDPLAWQNAQRNEWA
jgi:hypothetical protein